MKTSIAQRLRELGANRGTERRRAAKLARQEAALDHFRKYGGPPSQKTRLGASWANWVSNGIGRDPEFVLRAQAAGWESVELRTVRRKKEALDYLREFGHPPRKGTALCKAWIHWTAPSEKGRDPRFVKEARALGWRPQCERTAAVKQDALDYFRKNGRPPPFKTPLGDVWTNRVSPASASYDVEFVNDARALGWRPQSERSK